MTTHPTAGRSEWLAARLDLLKAEKELTRRSDAVAQQRQALPWVKIDKTYRFETEEGPATLPELFRGRSQLLVYHFMFGPDYTAGCPSCSAIADSFNGIIQHLANHDVMLWAVSRAPLEKLLAYRKRMDWNFPWASSSGGDFNGDFGVFFTPDEQREGLEFNYAKEPPLEIEEPSNRPAMPTRTTQNGPGLFADMTGTTVPVYTQDRPGMSAFVMEDGALYHAYSSYSRGVDGLWSVYQWLDRAPKGRNETGAWMRRKDEYGNTP